MKPPSHKRRRTESPEPSRSTESPGPVMFRPIAVVRPSQISMKTCPMCVEGRQPPLLSPPEPEHVEAPDNAPVVPIEAAVAPAEIREPEVINLTTDDEDEEDGRRDVINLTTDEEYDEEEEDQPGGAIQGPALLMDAVENLRHIDEITRQYQAELMRRQRRRR